MRRRTFLGLIGALAAAGGAGGRAPRPARAAADRLTWWDPAPAGGLPPAFVALEWRYLAGRVAAGGEDFGFVVSLADYKPFPAFGIGGRNELLVMRQEFGGAGAHAHATYPGALSYDPATATYSFAGDDPAVSASWRLDAAAQRYTLAVASPELTLADLLAAPAGALIAEGGDGVVSSGTFSYNGQPVAVQSDYFADWATLSRGGAPVGVGRLDMQTLRPTFGGGSAPTGFSHHWFAVAATLEDGTPAWVSGWQILAGAGVAWCVTVATGQGAGWGVESVGTDGGFSGAQPLDVAVLEYQAIPGASPAARTGSRWRLRAGRAAPGDLIDLDLAVAPGQFIKGARVGATGISMQESVAPGARGLIGGRGIRAASLAIMESTLSEPGAPPAVPQRLFLPLTRA